MPHRVFNLEQVAEYLHLHPDRIRTLVQRNDIPFEQFGARLAFRKRDIDAWASKKILQLPADQLMDYQKKVGERLEEHALQEPLVSSLISASYIEPTLESKTKASVIRGMVQLAGQTELVADEEELLRTIQARENICSTAVAGGIALLHPENQDPYLVSDSFIVLGRCIQPVPFSAPDGGRTDLFFLVCCQDDSIHLRVLARLCLLCSQANVLQELREKAHRKQMYEALRGAEEEALRSLA